MPRDGGDDDPLSASLAPFNAGFIRMFTANGKSMSAAAATVLSIPATYATAFGFIFSYGRVVVSMARSRLFPEFLSATYGEYQTPYAAFIFGSVFGYVLCVLVYFVPYVGTLLFNQCIVSAFFAYCSQCMGFAWFKFKHQNQHRAFVSPLGYFGAVYGFLVFLLAGICVLFFAEDDYVALIIFSCQVILYTLYYYGYARKRQSFSPEEKFVFIAQIVKCELVGARSTSYYFLNMVYMFPSIIRRLTSPYSQS